MALSIGACTSTSAAQQSYEEFKIEPRESIVGDSFGVRFGAGVGVSGGIVAVGSTRCDEGYGITGAVFLYDSETGIEQGVLVPNDPQADQYFGEEVIVTDSKIIVSAIGDSIGGVWSGAVYVFDRLTLNQDYKLTSDNPMPNMQYGRNIAASGNTLIVGERGPFNGAPSAGSAYVYDLSTGALLHVLKATNPTSSGELSDSSDQFGFDVDLDESMGIAIVGAPFANAATEDSGAAYVFDLTTGAEIARLESAEPEEHEGYGWSVSVSQGRGLVGAPRRYEDGQYAVGSMYLIDLDDPQQPVYGPRVSCPDTDPDYNEWFGANIVLDERFAIVAATGEDDRDFEETVYLFDVSDMADPRHILSYRASDGDGVDQFGDAIASDGSRVVVGAYFDWNNGLVRGSSYVFDLPDSSCLADLNQDTELNFFDVSAFLMAYQSQDPIADFNDDGSFDFFDVSAFLSAFNAGCS
jgi:hypothetical protein